MYPISAYIVKVTAFCNLNCTYCYVFNLDDKSFRGRPKVMPLETLGQSARRIVSMAKEQCVGEVSIIFHGGEPLLAGYDWFRRAIGCFLQAAGSDLIFHFAVQTNAVTLDEEWVELFREYSMSVSVSLDGPPEVNDKARINHSGHGSYDAVVKGLKLVQDEPFFGGLLCVIDSSVNGLEVYRHFRDLGVRRMDFLFPHEHNWDHPPVGHQDPCATPYADYLIPIFDEWWSEDDPTIDIRTFKTLLGYLIGNKAGVDALGGNPVTFAVIETEGSIEPLDVLRACGDGMTQLGLNVHRDEISALSRRRLYQEAIKGQEGLCEACTACPLHDICGAGYLPHRFSAESGFRNPSVYCRDLWKLISHIADAASRQLHPALLDQGAAAATLSSRP